MRRWLRNNSLSLVLFGLFFGTLAVQSLTGWAQHNNEQREHGEPAVGYFAYVTSGNFVEATFENWESEFLQMASFVILAVFLFQKGSPESRDPDQERDIDTDPRVVSGKVKAEAPWPVRRGGWALRLYENSLFLAFLVLFVLSFVLHAAGGVDDYNEQQAMHGGGAGISMWRFMTTAEFWFQSMQNWQSEFLALGTMVVFSIFLRQKHSPESKPVHAPHSRTGH